MLEILLKYEIFYHPGPVNHKNLAKSINYSHIEILLKFEIFDQPGPVKHEIWQN